MKEAESTLIKMKALASDKRLAVMNWLKDPVRHFPPQEDGDLVIDGVCVGFIAEKLAIAQPTATTHMKILQEAGLVTSKKIKQWTFYKRNEAAMRELAALLSK